MAYIKKNVNTMLLFLIIILIIATVWLTTQYQGTYSNLTTEYNTKLNELKQLGQNLSTKTTELNKSQEELQMRLQDKSKFNVLYLQVTAERDTLSSELTQTKDTLTTTKDTLLQTQETLESTTGQLDTCNAKVTSLTNRIEQKDSEICTLKKQLGQEC